MENGFGIVQYFVVKTQQDDVIEMLALYMCTKDGGGGGGGGGGALVGGGRDMESSAFKNL